MCGICGVVRPDPHAASDEAALTVMRDALTHRGPDDAGKLVEAGVGLGSRRLAIRDLSPRGHMPMRTPDGRYSIVYNGEVYNCEELRRQLEGRGGRSGPAATPRSCCTVRGFGPAMLARLNGMFALAIWTPRATSSSPATGWA